MADPSPPVFYDCEASSLDGFVIEVGWAYARPDDGQIIAASYLVLPLAEWQIATVWDENAEALHFNCRDFCARHSRTRYC